jgi:predicted amidophosphoribosyltransferase
MPWWFVAAGLVGVAAWAFGSRRRSDSSGGEESGNLLERLERNCEKDSRWKNRFYFDRYVRWGRHQTDFSKQILKLKDKNDPVIREFARCFRFLRGLDDLVLIRVPPHVPNEVSGMELLARRIAREYGVTNESANLKRVVEVPQRKISRGEDRSMSETQRKQVFDSLELVDPDGLEGKEVLLIDDVATTWDTMDCCESIIARDAYPGAIYCLVLGRTNPPRR